jgi:hypothetical protein
MQKLKSSDLISINTQQDLNDLADICGVDIVDAIVIDDEYVAYLEFIGSDENGAVKVEKFSEYREENPYDTRKPRKFSSWKMKFKNYDIRQQPKVSN